MLGRWREMASGAGHVPNDSTHRIQYEPLRDDVVGTARTALWVLQGAVGFVPTAIATLMAFIAGYAAILASLRLRVEVTGPWAAYSFTDDPDAREEPHGGEGAARQDAGGAP